MKKARIIKIVSSRYEVLDENWEIVCYVLRGKTSQSKSPVVGDLVMIEEFENQIGIQKILPRKNELVRPLSQM